jgi:lipopolysaccharide/colanic/teichoic acid biosynthesis glycosyltransferase
MTEATGSLAERYAALAQGSPPRGRDLALRGLDIALALVLIVVSLPFQLVIAVAILVTSGTPILYRGARVGLEGRVFTMLKFRTLSPDAETRLGPYLEEELVRRTEAETTRLGRRLRATQLDELPQFWNVLLGDMSLVGPRPERPVFVKQFRTQVPHYMLRHKVRAGITGWAQVNGWRGNTSIEKRIEYDLYYIENWSVMLDLKIMWLTLVKGFFHKHAY